MLPLYLLFSPFTSSLDKCLNQKILFKINLQAICIKSHIYWGIFNIHTSKHCYSRTQYFGVFPHLFEQIISRLCCLIIIVEELNTFPLKTSFHKYYINKLLVVVRRFWWYQDGISTKDPGRAGTHTPLTVSPLLLTSWASLYNTGIVIQQVSKHNLDRGSSTHHPNTKVGQSLE